MTRKAAAKKAKKVETPPEPQPFKVYIAVREMASVNRSYTEPDRIFVSREAAQEHADRLNRELRACGNPFADEHEPAWLMKSEKRFFKLLKKLDIAEPKPPKGGYVRWDQWWARAELTDTQREAIWDAFDVFEWYKVRETTLED